MFYVQIQHYRDSSDAYVAWYFIPLKQYLPLWFPKLWPNLGHILAKTIARGSVNHEENYVVWRVEYVHSTTQSLYWYSATLSLRLVTTKLLTSMSESIRNPFTLCGEFWKMLPWGSVTFRWTSPLDIPHATLTPSVVHLTKILHRGCLDFK